MERAFQTALWLLRPEILFIRGDIFHEGKGSTQKVTQDPPPPPPCLQTHRAYDDDDGGGGGGGDACERTVHRCRAPATVILCHPGTERLQVLFFFFF